MTTDPIILFLRATTVNLVSHPFPVRLDDDDEVDDDDEDDDFEDDEDEDDEEEGDDDEPETWQVAAPSVVSAKVRFQLDFGH